MGVQLLGPKAEVASFVALGAYLAGAGIFGGGAFVVATYLLGVSEIRELWQRGRAWCQARAGDSRRG
jgi:hypothetical protein